MVASNGRESFQGVNLRANASTRPTTMRFMSGPTDTYLSGLDFGPVLGWISGTKSAKKLHYFVHAGLAFLSLFELSVPALARAEAQIKDLPRC